MEQVGAAQSSEKQTGAAPQELLAAAPCLEALDRLERCPASSPGPTLSVVSSSSGSSGPTISIVSEKSAKSIKKPAKMAGNKDDKTQKKVTDFFKKS